MPVLIQYLLKLTISLAVVWLFYHFILRKLTFYSHNRWYLLGYSLLSFFIPLVNIAPALQQNELGNSRVLQWIPQFYQADTAASAPLFTAWTFVFLLIGSGMLVLFFRLLVQLLSFRKMMKKATLLASQEVNVYQVDGPVIPFSFGNAVFLNPALHSSEELEEIIRHEFVHVKQRHSLDILFSEVLCLLNWYNPFAWLIRSSIRQNLEFIADHKVLEKGTNKKQYQYLLLKVIGNNQFSIAPKFNFSSLSKRIAMMNKLQSSKKHLLRFLFLLPVLAFILVSFRKEIGDTLSGRQRTGSPPVMTDTIPHPSSLNEKGYQITVKDNKGNCLLVIKDKNGKEVKQMLLTDWNKDAAKYEALYGEIPPAPPAPRETPAPPGNALMKDFLERNPSIREVGWVYNLDNTAAILHLNMKDGTTQQYDLRNEDQRKAAETKYGELPLLALTELVVEGQAAPPSPPGVVEVAGYPAQPAPPAVVELPSHVKSINIDNGKATVILKDGKKENYDLNKPDERKEFEKKYGVPPTAPVPPAPARGTAMYKAEFDYKDNKVTVKKDGKKEVYDLSDPVQRTEFRTIYDKPVIVPDHNYRLQQVTVPDKPVVTTMPLEAVVVEGRPITTTANPVTNLKLSEPVIATTEAGNVKLAEVRVTQPVRSNVNLVLEEKALTPSTIDIGGLGLKNEDQYILVDGKEYKPNPDNKLKGRYRISFVDKKESVKKYGEKARNGAIIVETIK